MSGSGQNGGVNVVNDKPFWEPQQMEEFLCKQNSFRRLQAHAVASDRDSHREGGMDAVMFRLRTMKASHRKAPSRGGSA